MAKRFTDTEKWKKSFIKGLKPKYKLLWFYILDDCNHAGIWEVDMKVASLRIGCRITLEDAFVHVGSKVTPIGRNKWFINDFVLFQYGELNPKNRLHQSVISILNSYNIPINKGLVSPLEGAKEKDKVKDMDKDKEIGGAGEKTDADFKYEFKPDATDEKLADAEWWTEQVVTGNDVRFIEMIRRRELKAADLDRMARDHLDTACRYGWHQKWDSQQAFRQSLLKHVTELINKQPNGNQPKKEISLAQLKGKT